MSVLTSDNSRYSPVQRGGDRVQLQVIQAGKATPIPLLLLPPMP